MKNTIVKLAAINALATAAYIVGVASFMFYIPKTWDKQPTPLIPIAMLSLLVCSAALTGSLVFGRPVLWFLDGKKKESFQLLASTLAILFLFTLAAFLGLAWFAR